MNILTLIVIGLIIGVLAKFLISGRDPVGYLLTFAAGVTGALMGGAMLTTRIFHNASEVAGWIVAIIGAVIWLKYNETLSQ